MIFNLYEYMLVVYYGDILYIVRVINLNDMICINYLI